MKWNYQTIKPGKTAAAQLKRATDGGYVTYLSDHRGTHLRKPFEAEPTPSGDDGTKESAPKRKRSTRKKTN